jgi:hypothetical protein
MHLKYLLCAAGLAAAAPIAAADFAHPAVVELYQSQGCSSCPPADVVLNGIADRPDVLALSFAVTYWDDLGWKDTFASPAFTRRQWDYAHAGGRGNVATPQVIVNGRGVLTGNRRADVDAAIAQFDRGASGPSLTIADKSVSVGAGRGAATLWLVHYDPRTIAVPIRAGENGGRTIPHRNIVRQLVKLGTWNGQPVRFTLPASPAGLLSAVLLQSGTGGPIVASRRL